MYEEKKPFHGWYIVGVCFVVSLLFGGFIMHVPWMIHFFQALLGSAEKTHLDFGLAISQTMLPLFFLPLLVGWLVDRFGCKKLILAGCAISGAGMILYVGVSELWHYTLSSFLVIGGAAAATSIPIDALLVRWFRKHRGLAIAIATMGSGLGLMVMKLPNSVLWEAIAGRKSALLIGAVALVITIPLILRVIKDLPSEMGLDPDGIAPDEDEPAEPIGHTLAEAIRTPTFWYIVGALFFVNVLSAVPMWSLISHLRDTGSPIGSLIVAGEMLRGLPILFFPLIGLLADRRGATQTFVLLVCVSAAGVGFFLPMPASWIFVGFPLLQGICAGVVLVSAPIIIAERHGLSNFGIIYAALMLLGGLGMTVAGLMIGFTSGSILDAVLDSTMGFRIILASEAVLLLLSAYLIRKTKPLTVAESPPFEAG